MKYIFILGNNSELSIAEIKAVLPTAKILAVGKEYLGVEAPKFDCQEMITRLGGTIKIGIFLGNKFDEGPVLGTASTATGRFNFGFSFYNQKSSDIGMSIKKQLKAKGISSRLVVSREQALSSVIVTKEKCHDFLIGPDFFGMTCAVQDFKEYGERDFGRPKSDALSGMLPPKVAKMMINLSMAEKDQIILDPFCGSGTILSEALAMGFESLIGCDNSEKAINDSKENLKWLADKLPARIATQSIAGGRIKNEELRIFKSDVRNLSQEIKEKSVDAIITEPYLGPAMRGSESEEKIQQIINELEDLYTLAFAEFKKVLKAGGKAIVIMPEWHIQNKIWNLSASGRIEKVKKMGFEKLDKNNLYYKREDQKVWRQITVWQKISQLAD
ncbi:MAG: DNA methyltransferase [bacterium]